MVNNLIHFPMIRNIEWESVWSTLYSINRNDVLFFGVPEVKTLYIILRNISKREKLDSNLLEEAYRMCLDADWHNIHILENPEVVYYDSK